MKTGQPSWASAPIALLACFITGAALCGTYVFETSYVVHRFKRQPVKIDTVAVRFFVDSGRGAGWYLDTELQPKYVTLAAHGSSSNSGMAGIGHGG